MATFSGRNARVSVIVDDVEKIVSEMATWSISSSAEEVDASVFGDVWGKKDLGMLDWSASISGFVDPTDTLGQEVMASAFLTGELVKVRFYLKYSETEQAVYYEGDCRVSGWNVNAEAKSIGKLDASLSGSGAYTTTVSTSGA